MNQELFILQSNQDLFPLQLSPEFSFISGVPWLTMEHDCPLNPQYKHRIVHEYINSICSLFFQIIHFAVFYILLL